MVELRLCSGFGLLKLQFPSRVEPLVPQPDEPKWTAQPPQTVFSSPLLAVRNETRRPGGENKAEFSFLPSLKCRNAVRAQSSPSNNCCQNAALRRVGLRGGSWGRVSSPPYVPFYQMGPLRVLGNQTANMALEIAFQPVGFFIALCKIWL